MESVVELAKRKRVLEDRKKELKEKTAKIETDLVTVNKQLYNTMLISDMQSVTIDGYIFSLSPQAKANVRIEDREALYQGLRENGLGSLITESVNAQTLDRTMRDLLEKHGGVLPEWAQPYVSMFTVKKISMQKTRK